MTHADPQHSLRIRWVRPAWLTWGRAQIYSSLPPHVLDDLVSRRLLRTRNTLKGRLIMRDSIDRLLER
jgi:hypothetical protein